MIAYQENMNGGSKFTKWLLIRKMLMGEAKDAADTPLAIGYGYLNSDGFLKDIQRGRALKSARLYDIRI